MDILIIKLYSKKQYIFDVYDDIIIKILSAFNNIPNYDKLDVLSLYFKGDQQKCPIHKTN